MTKTITTPPRSDFETQKQRLLRLMDAGKVSLVQAAQLLNIPYPTAKKILFICGSPRQEALKESSLKNKVHQISKMPIRSQQEQLKKKLSPVLKSNLPEPKQVVPANSPKVQISRPKPAEHTCNQCNCSCCPYVRARMEREAAARHEMQFVHYQEYVPMPIYYSPPSHPYEFYPQYHAPQMMLPSRSPPPNYSVSNSRKYSVSNSRDSYSTADSFSSMSSHHMNPNMIPRALMTARSTGATTPVFREEYDDFEASVNTNLADGDGITPEKLTKKLRSVAY